jgi:putative transposase
MKKTARRKQKSQADNRSGFLPGLAATIGEAHQDLRELVIRSGMKVLAEMLEAERSEMCGARYTRGREDLPYRHGRAPSELVMGGRKVRVSRPRVRNKQGEVALPIFDHFSSQDPLDERAVESMLIGVSTRNYDRGLEALPQEMSSRGTSKSSVSRRFVQATKEELDAWSTRSLADLRIRAVMIDGIAFGQERVVLIAVGIGEAGTKHVLGIHEGATENAAACSALLSDIVSRGIKTNKSMLFVIDGAKALASAIADHFGARGLIQRCQVHKKRNVREHLPQDMRPSVAATMSQAYAMSDATRAKKILENLARSLDVEYPSAAASLREGLQESLTVVRLALPIALRRGFATTNTIESINSSVRNTTRRVKTWQSGEMVLRWTSAALIDAEQRFHRVKGYKDMYRLIRALDDNDERLDRDLDDVKATG